VIGSSSNSLSAVRECITQGGEIKFLECSECVIWGGEEKFPELRHTKKEQRVYERLVIW
jgi:hypothetical protein